MYYMVAIVIGIASHVILDILTPKGVKLFYPLPLNVVSYFILKQALVDLSLATAFSFGTVYTLFQPFLMNLCYSG